MPGRVFIGTRTLAMAFCVLAGVASFVRAQDKKPGAGFTRIFDGKSFDGWEGDTRKSWSIENGAFVAGSLEVLFPRNEFLATKKQYSNFELKLEYKVLGSEGFVNGGVQFRSRRVPNHHEMIGYQADLGAGYDGFLYDETRRNRFLTEAAQEIIQSIVKKGDWNRYRIRAQGRRVELWVNDVKTADFVEPDDKIPGTGHIAVQVHGAGKVRVHYRNIEIRELPDDAPSSSRTRVDASFLRKDLVGYWSFDGHTKSPKPVALEGERHGGASFVDSPFGKALSVDGKDDFVVVPRHESMNVGAENFSLAAWVRSHDLRQAGFICLGRYGWIHGWYFDMPHANGMVRLETVRPDRKLNGKVETRPGAIVPNEWMHVAISVDRRANKTVLYVNGYPLARGTIPEVPLDNPNVSLHFGRIEGSQLFRGEIDEVYFFRRALAANEIQALVEPGRTHAVRPSNLAPSVRRFGKGRGGGKSKGRFPDGRFVLEPGDTVALTGQTDTARSRIDASLETALSLRFATAKPRFRNMAWEGDTVFEQWRDIAFGTWADQLAAIDASVIVAQFGQMEAIDSKAADISRFIGAYERLLHEFSNQTERIVLVSPRPFEKPELGSFPNHVGKNTLVERYVEAIRDLAARRGYLFVDLYQSVKKGDLTGRLTKNGVHLTPDAHARVATVIARQLGVERREGTGPAGLTVLIETIREKNRLWFDNWRPMNWAFAFGDRTSQPFSRPHGERPALRIELEEFKPLVANAERRIAEITEAITTAKALPDPTAPSSRKKTATPDAKETRRRVDEQLASFQIADEYEIELFASEADGVVNPLHMRWDDSNRLWILCAPTYPHIEPGKRPRDYVLVCEDTDRDGRADRFHRFAEDLFMPQGIEFGNGGVYLAEATELVHLRDTDGDGRADSREVVLSGFGTADSHQMINGLSWGPNGALWFTQGHHVYSHVETPWGISKLHKAGVWRYRPRTGRLDAFFNLSTAGLNCQSVDFDDFGQVFHNSAALSEGFYTVAGMIPTSNPRRYWSLSPPKPRNTGIEIIGTTHLPENLQGTLVFSGYISNDVQLRKLVDENSGFATRALPNLMKSTRLDFRPVCTRIGPDGAIYICDWYNPIIGHYQASYRDPRRDKTHGRVWRVTAKDRPLAKPVDLTKLPIPQLLDAQRSPERLVRRNAQRRLFDLPTAKVVESVDTWLAALDRTAPDYERLVLFAVGVLEAHEVVRPKLLSQLLEADDPRVRAYGVRVVGNWASRLDRPLDLLRQSIRDAHPRVRLETVVACSYVDSPHAIEVAAQAVDMPMDRFLDYALKQAVVALKPKWLPALERGELHFDGQIGRLRFVLETDGTRDVVGFVHKLAFNDSVSKDQRSSLLTLLVEIGSPRDLIEVWKSGHLDPTVLASFARAATIHGRKPLGITKAHLTPHLHSRHEWLRAGALRLAGLWHIVDLQDRVAAVLDSPREPPSVVRAAIDALPRLTGVRAVPRLVARTAPDQLSEIRQAASAALATVDLEESASAAARLLAESKEQSLSVGVLAPLLEQRGGTRLLALAFDRIKLSADAAKLIHRALSTAGRSDAELLAALNRAIGIESIDRPYDAEFVRKLAAEAMEKGDVARGQKIFSSSLANCTGCHRHENRGGDTGPDLTAIGAGRSAELLTESILFPNRQIREGYMSRLVVTNDGRVVTGYTLKETVDELHLRDTATNKIRRIAKNKIMSITDAGSVMPKGVTSALTRPELLDLVRFVSSLGRSSTP